MIKSRLKLVTLMGTTILSALPFMAAAQSTDNSETEVIVTAQKRSERLQSVPIAIQAITTKKLDQLNISKFDDYAVLLPSVSFQTGAPGAANIYMRGAASGGDGNHSASLPSVGVYLDEQPITTIGGTVDINIYDIARIESLAGPQGTLYGASSQAGTIRIITNKPDTSGFYGRFDVEGNVVSEGGMGGSFKGMVNVPLNDKAALRAVGWVRKDSGYIDNVRGTRSFIGSVTVNNTALVEDDFNDVLVYGGRAALKVDLNVNWTATGTLMGQSQRANGVFGYDQSVGDLKVQHFYPDTGHDRFYQAAATIQGKIANLDVTYAVSHLERTNNTVSDYTDYAEQYDALYASYGGIAGYFYIENALGADIDPRQYIEGRMKYEKTSHELRFASPSDKRLRFIGGLFFQEQVNDIHQDYRIPGLAPAMSVNGNPGTLWLTEQIRTDKDTAIFGEVTFDITDKFSTTLGLRQFEYENDLIGFFGFGRNPAGPPWNGAGSSRTGVAGCYAANGQTVRTNFTNSVTSAILPGVVAGTPCTNLGQFSNGTVIPKVAEEDGSTYRINLSYKASENRLIYLTASNGFRPGGINRRADVDDYDADFLTNLELGFKGTLYDGRLRLNAALYQQEWQTFQFSFLGQNSFTEIHNGPNADLTGFELDFTYVPTSDLTFNGSLALNDAKLANNLCKIDDPTYTCTGAGNSIEASAGTRLPITPEYKFSGSVRYNWDWNNHDPYWQVVGVTQGDTRSNVRNRDAVTLDGYSLFNFAMGGKFNGLDMELFIKNLTDERTETSTSVQCGACTRRYYVTTPPRTFGIRLGSKF